MLREHRYRNHIKCSVKTRQGRNKTKDKKGTWCGGGISTVHKTMTNMGDINPTMSVISLNVSCLNTSIKRQRPIQWIKKIQLSIVYKKSTLNVMTQIKGLKVEGWRKRYHANTYQKKVRVAILILDKADIRTRKDIRRKKGALCNDEEVNYPRKHDIL